MIHRYIFQTVDLLYKSKKFQQTCILQRTDKAAKVGLQARLRSHNIAVTKRFARGV